MLTLLCCPVVWGQEQRKPNCGGIEYPEAVVPSPISLNERVKAASAVFEGRVVDRYKITTENEKKYTCYVVQVYRIFKGNFVADTVEVITFTDSDTYRKSFSQTESLWTYGIGIFFTEPTTKFNTFTQSTRKKFQFYSPYYGHIEEFEQIEHPENMHYSAVQKTQTLHKSVAKYAHKKPKVVKEIYKKKSTANQRQSSITTITSFSPSTIVAGNMNQLATGTSSSLLTINGNGFGALKGNVFFKNANVGGNLSDGSPDWFKAHKGKHIISWTDTQIKVLVPSRGYNSGTQTAVGKGAGSGFFKVETYDETQQCTSSQLLNIKYSLNNYAIQADETDPASWLYYELHLRDTNGDANDQSDFTFIYDASFYGNAPAVAAFRRALNTWRKATGVRFTEICNTSFNLCKDVNEGTRVKVSFNKTATQCPPPTTFSAAFAQTTVALDLDQDPNALATLACPGDVKAYINFMHMVFKPDNLDCRDGINSDCQWNFSSANNATNKDYNFEMVALHELGHLLMQNHVLEPSLMYWEGNPGVAATSNRTNLKIPNPTDPTSPDIDDPALEGVNYVLARDATLDCPPFVPVQILPTEERIDLPACSFYCPTPNLDTDATFTATASCSLDGSAPIYHANTYGIATNTIVTLSVINPSVFESYTWDVADGTLISNNANYTVITVQWNTAGNKLIELVVDDNGSCTTRQMVIDVHNAVNYCQMPANAIASFVNPTTCTSNNGSITFNTPTQGSLCYWYSLTKQNTVLFNNYIAASNTAAHTYSNLSVGTYTLTIIDQLTNCFTNQTVQLTTATPLVITGEVANNYITGACTGSVNITNVEGGTSPYTYTWSNGATTALNSNLCSNLVTGVSTYTVTVTDSNGCTSTKSADVQSSFHIAINESACNCDLLIEGSNPVGNEILATARLSAGSNTPPNSNAQVLLELYNSMGIKVATMYNGSLPVPSNQQNSYSSANLLPGLYYLRLQACGKSKTKPIVKP